MNTSEFVILRVSAIPTTGNPYMPTLRARIMHVILLGT
jgi:hypothetical protein